MTEKLLRTISSWVVTGAAFILLSWVFLITAYIISRFTDISWLFVEEFTGYMLVWISFASLAYGLITDKHISLTIVTRRLPERVRNILKRVTDGIGLIIICLLMYYGINWVIRGYTMNIHSESRYYILMWPLYLAIPIGLFLFALVMLLKLVKGDRFQPMREKDEITEN